MRWAFCVRSIQVTSYSSTTRRNAARCKRTQNRLIFYVGILTVALMQAVDLTGQVFGRWTVLGPRLRRRGLAIWRCRCSCGTVKWVVSQTLRNGSSRSCGCLFREAALVRFLKTLDGMRFTRLRVLPKNDTRNSKVHWLCECDCGRRLWITSAGLRNGSTKSCGCLNRELSGERARFLKRHRVFLTQAERQQLQKQNNIESQILVLSDESETGPHLTDKQIIEHLGVTRTKVEYTRTKFAAPEEIRRRAGSALKQMAQDPRRKQLRLETLRRYSSKPTTKLKGAAYRQNMPLHVKEHIRTYRQKYKRRLEVRLRENERERAWRRTAEGKERKRLYVERGKQRSNARWRERYAREVTFRIRHALRARLRLALKHRGIRKPRSTLELVGCTPSELRIHLERQFLTGMTWANHGQWHIDHIIPCAQFDLTDPDTRRRCFHFSNLQPLWAVENIRKGGRLVRAN